MVTLVPHQHGCPERMGHSDAAKRVADTYNMHRAALGYDSIGKWFAAALADGTSDNDTYPDKQTAIAFQHHNENYYTFIQIVPSTMTACEAEVMLKVARRIYDAGGRMTDGFEKHDVIKRSSWEDQSAQSIGIVQNILFGREN